MCKRLFLLMNRILKVRHPRSFQEVWQALERKLTRIVFENSGQTQSPSALPESIKFRVPDPELDRELGTYNGGN
jgi:hypothetical protein